MYRQIKNIIGVNPSFYEHLFMVDADTTVDPLSVNHLRLSTLSLTTFGLTVLRSVVKPF
jgi:Chitin synthase